MSNDSSSDEKPDSNNSSKNDVDQLKKDLKNADEKIEKMEEKIIKQEKKVASLSKSKSETTTLVLSLVVGLMGIMGVGHMYVGRVRRGAIILIIGILSWTAFFIPIAILGVMGELEEEPSDPGVIIGMIVGFVLVGIGVLILFIWQILNARTLCKEYNEYLEQNENPPW